MNRIFSIALLITVFLSFAGCSPFNPGVAQPELGHIYELGRFGTQQGIDYVLQGGAGTQIMRNGNSYVFIWDLGGRGIAFWAFDYVKLTAIASVGNMKYLLGLEKANIVSPSTLTDLTAFMKQNGWTVISAEELSIIFKMNIIDYALLPIRDMPTFFLATSNQPWTTEQIMDTINPKIKQ